MPGNVFFFCKNFQLGSLENSNADDDDNNNDDIGSWQRRERASEINEKAKSSGHQSEAIKNVCNYICCHQMCDACICSM